MHDWTDDPKAPGRPDAWTTPQMASPQDLLENAFQERARAKLVPAVVQAYQALRSGGEKDPEVSTTAHLFLSEVFAEMAYHGFARLHAREALRAAELGSPNDACLFAPRHLRLAAALREGGDNALAEAQLMWARAAASACPDASSALRAQIELETARLLAGRIGNPGEDAVSLLTRANGHIERSRPVDAGALPVWSAEAFLLQAKLLAEVCREVPPPHRTTMLDCAARLLEDTLKLVGEDPSLLRCRVLREKATVTRLQGQSVDAINILMQDLDQSGQLRRISTETVLGLVLCAGHQGNQDLIGKLSSMMLERDLYALREFGEFATEGDQLAYAERLRLRGDTCISLLVRHQAKAPELRDRLLDFAVARKAVVADVEQAFWLELRRLQDPMVLEAMHALAERREELGARLSAKLPEGAARRMQEIERRYQVLAVEPSWRSFSNPGSQEKRQVEGYLARLQDTGSNWSAVEAAAPMRNSTPKGADILACLGKSTVLVEILRVRDIDIELEKLSERADYWALVVSVGRPIEAIALGDAADIDGAIQRTLNVLRRSRPIEDANAQEEALADLANRLWAPLAEAVGEAERILICAEGPICLCPFAALPVSDGSFLIEQKLVQQLASTRDLLPEKREASSEARQEIAIVASVDFGDPSRQIAGGLGITLPQLKQAQKEAKAVSQFFTAPVPIVGGADATSEWFRKLASPRILHIITHGLVLPDTSDGQGDEPSTEDEWAAKSALARHLARLSRSGLALSGFHQVRPGTRSEGMLTALAAGALDLRGTELVVLSACDSGVGQPAPSEGLIGLPRAFRAAGAQAVLMSLWQLHDGEAAFQMGNFYRMYSANNDPVVALATAQRQSIKYWRKALKKAPAAVWAPLSIIGAAQPPSTLERQPP